MKRGELNHHELEQVVDFLLHYMGPAQRTRLMAEMPVHYAKLFPGVNPEAIIGRVTMAIDRVQIVQEDAIRLPGGGRLNTRCAYCGHDRDLERINPPNGPSMGCRDLAACEERMGAHRTGGTLPGGAPDLLA